MNKDIKGITEEANNFLMKYEWPGNVRELENTIERAIVIGKGDIIQIDDLNMSKENKEMKLNGTTAEENGNSLNDMEKRYIIKVLNDNNWNISKSAEILEIERVTLYNKINKYDLRKNK